VGHNAHTTVLPRPLLKLVSDLTVASFSSL
jgi:hypothetical protein